MKKFGVKIKVKVGHDVLTKIEEATLLDALTNFGNNHIGSTADILDASQENEYFEDTETEVYTITLKLGDEIKADLEGLIRDDLYEYVQAPFLYENFGVHGNGTVDSVEITGIDPTELREEAVKVSQEYYNEYYSEPGVIYKII